MAKTLSYSEVDNESVTANVDMGIYGVLVLVHGPSQPAAEIRPHPRGLRRGVRHHDRAIIGVGYRVTVQVVPKVVLTS